MKDAVINDIFDLVGIIADPKIRALTYANIGVELFRMGNKKYKDAFRKALETAEEIEDAAELTFLLIQIATYLGETNKAIAIGVFDRVLELVERMPSKTRNSALEKMVEAALKLKLYDLAVSYAMKIKDDKVRNSMLISIIKGYLSEGQLAKAIKVSKELLEEPWSSMAKSEIIKYHIKSGEITNALDIFNTIEENRERFISEIVEELVESPEHVSKFFELLRGEELVIAAKKLLDILIKSPTREYIELVERIAERIPDESVQVKVVAFLTRVGEKENALKYANRMQNDYLRSLAFGEIALGYLKENDLDRAIETVEHVRDLKWNSRLLAEILIKILKLTAEEESKQGH